jgi:nitrite reductase (NADH) large subunit
MTHLVLGYRLGSHLCPIFQGIEKDGVFVYRTIDDLDLIKAYAAKRQSPAR